MLNLNIEACYRILKIGGERVLKMSRHAPITAMFSRKDVAIEIIALLLFPLVYWLKYYVHELGHALPAFLFGHEFRIDVVEQGFGMYEGRCHISSFPTPDPTVNFIIFLSGGLIGGLFMSIFYVVLRRRFVSLAYLWIAISQFAYMVVESLQATMYPEFLMISLFIALDLCSRFHFRIQKEDKCVNDKGIIADFGATTSVFLDVLVCYPEEEVSDEKSH